MKVQFKFIVLLLIIHSVVYSASICSNREFVDSFKSGVLSSGGNAYCQGNTFYVVAQAYSQSDFEQVRQNLNASDLLARACPLFDEALRLANSIKNLNLRGNLAYVFEYNGQRIQYSCP